MAKTIQEVAEQCARAHRRALTNPQELGEITRVWSEGKGKVICIEYDTGAWYHYTHGPSGGLVWY